MSHLNVEKLLIYREQAWQRVIIGLWSLQIICKLSCRFRQPHGKRITKKKLTEAGLKLLQYTVGYKLKKNLRQTFGAFLEIFTSFASWEHHALV